VVPLQPTSPLRAVGDIDRCLEYFIAKHADSCVSITKVQQSPDWMCTLDTGGVIRPFSPSIQTGIQHQDQSPVYALNGAIYIAGCNYLTANRAFVGTATLGFVMPLERSIDVDTEIDLKLASVILERNHGKT
jgi:CMP-N,N'-diacetyllegionaminic acid synthase